MWKNFLNHKVQHSWSSYNDAYCWLPHPSHLEPSPGRRNTGANLSCTSTSLLCRALPSTPSNSAFAAALTIHICRLITVHREAVKCSVQSSGRPVLEPHLWHFLLERPWAGHLDISRLIYKMGMTITRTDILRRATQVFHVKCSMCCLAHSKCLNNCSSYDCWILRPVSCICPVSSPTGSESPRTRSLSYPFLWLSLTPLPFQKSAEFGVFSHKDPGWTDLREPFSFKQCLNLHCSPITASLRKSVSTG